MWTKSRSLAVASVLAGLLVYACSGDSSPVEPPADGGGSPPRPTSDSSAPPDTDGGGGGADAGRDGQVDDAGCVFEAPPLDAGDRCGTLPFGKAQVAFGPVDLDAGNSYDGGVLPPGIYDAVIAERASASGGAWRETFVVDGNGRFTRTRQVTASVNPGPVTRRSGTYTLQNGSIRFVYDCAYNDDVLTDAGDDTLPYDVVGPTCQPRYRYGAAGIRLTLQRR
jgi:hypothetical protein